jgi:hypothetical protein
VIGLKDFPGDLIRAFQRHGFIFHAKATIWKDPVTAMQRTKALGLLHKSVRERSDVPHGHPRLPHHHARPWRS